MFSYNASKGTCWGAAMHPNDTLKAIQRTHAFLKRYFEPIEPSGLTLNLCPYYDTGNHVPRIRQKAIQIFGERGQDMPNDWPLAPSDYDRVMRFIFETHPASKKPDDPIWVSFRCDLKWRDAAMPNLRWPEGSMELRNEMQRVLMFSANLRLGGRFSFPMGIAIPVPVGEPASYSFLKQFCADAPFKVNPKNFLMAVRAGKDGKFTFRKPSEDVSAKLLSVVYSDRPR